MGHFEHFGKSRRRNIEFYVKTKTRRETRCVGYLVLANMEAMSAVWAIDNSVSLQVWGRSVPLQAWGRAREAVLFPEIVR